MKLCNGPRISFSYSKLYISNSHDSVNREVAAYIKDMCSWGTTSTIAALKEEEILHLHTTKRTLNCTWFESLLAYN